MILHHGVLTHKNPFEIYAHGFRVEFSADAGTHKSIRSHIELPWIGYRRGGNKGRIVSFLSEVLI